MAKLQSKRSTGREERQSTLSVGQLHLSQLLIDVKKSKNAVKRSKVLGGPLYDKLSDDVSNLYLWIDEHSIEELESIRVKERAVRPRSISPPRSSN